MTESPLNIVVLSYNRLGSSLSRFLFCLTLLSPSMAQGVRPRPKIEGDNFDGQRVLLPDAAAGRVAVLIFGFTRSMAVPMMRTMPGFGRSWNLR
jgi:hypothetical protein